MTSSYQSPRARLKSIVASPGFTMVPGACDPLTARQIESAGFQAVYLTGRGILPGPGLSRHRTPHHDRDNAMGARVVAAVGVPVIADADTGYGNALNVIRAVQEFERTGGGDPSGGPGLPQTVRPLRGEAGRLPGRDGGQDHSCGGHPARRGFLLIARTDARAVHGFEDAVERMHAYVQAGADIAFEEAPQSLAELQEIPLRLPTVPLLVNIFEGGKTPVVRADELEAMEYRLGIYPSQTQRVGGVRAVQRVLQVMREEQRRARQRGGRGQLRRAGSPGGELRVAAEGGQIRAIRPSRPNLLSHSGFAIPASPVAPLGCGDSLDPELSPAGTSSLAPNHEPCRRRLFPEPRNPLGWALLADRSPTTFMVSFFILRKLRERAS